MCILISWVKLPNGEIKYLTGKQLFETEKGKALIKEYPSPDDWAGHFLIRKYHGIGRLSGGSMNGECDDFSTPENFPPKIAEAIKSGEYRGFISFDVLEMLTKEAQRVYAAKNAKYDAFIKARDAFRKVCDVYDKAWVAYCEVADAYGEVAKDFIESEGKHLYFWDIFADPKNRIRAWR